MIIDYKIAGTRIAPGTSSAAIRNTTSAKANGRITSANTLFSRRLEGKFKSVPDVTMRKALYSLFFIAALSGAIAYGYWAQQRPVAHYLSDLRIEVAINQGQPSERGNLLGIQPELFPADYQDPTRLRLKLQGYMQEAQAQGLLNARTIVVLPEHIGTWLRLTGEKDELYQASKDGEADHWLNISNPLKFAWAWLRASGDDRGADARVRMKARHMAKAYQALFGGLAKEFGVTLVAGSIVLPEPYLKGDTLKVGSGALYNSSLVFGPDGRPLGSPLRQRLPGKYDSRYVQAADDAGVELLNTRIGRVGVLIGTDSEQATNLHKLETAGASAIVIPAYADDRIAPRPAITGETPVLGVYMHGHFWNRQNRGQSFIGLHDQTFEAAPGPGARLINLWL